MVKKAFIRTAQKISEHPRVIQVSFGCRSWVVQGSSGHVWNYFDFFSKKFGLFCSNNSEIYSVYLDINVQSSPFMRELNEAQDCRDYSFTGGSVSRNCPGLEHRTLRPNNNVSEILAFENLRRLRRRRRRRPSSMMTTTTIPRWRLPSFEYFSNFRSCRRDRFGPEILKIQVILAIFRPFGILTPLGS